jgi:hypothetical protein
MVDVVDFSSLVVAGAAAVAAFCIFSQQSRRLTAAKLRRQKEQEAAVELHLREAEAKLAAMEEVQKKLDALTYDDCHHQEESPLFNNLPGELRNEIFRWVLVQYEDANEDQRYNEDSYWYRPGFYGPHKSSSALLRTCRLAYCEGRRVIMKEAEHAFWFGESLSLLESVEMLTERCCGQIVDRMGEAANTLATDSSMH